MPNVHLVSAPRRISLAGTLRELYIGRLVEAGFELTRHHLMHAVLLQQWMGCVSERLDMRPSLYATADLFASTVTPLYPRLAGVQQQPLSGDVCSHRQPDIVIRSPPDSQSLRCCENAMQPFDVGLTEVVISRNTPLL